MGTLPQSSSMPPSKKSIYFSKWKAAIRRGRGFYINPATWLFTDAWMKGLYS